MQTTMTKNIALAGHAGSGKTTLCEALLYQSGVTERIGKITEGNTVSDYTAEEIEISDPDYETELGNDRVTIINQMEAAA